MAETLKSEELVNWVKTASRGEFTYEDYERWPEDLRLELDDGVVYLMGSSDERHQWTISEFGRQLGNQLLGKKCQHYVEWDVRLFYEEDKTDKFIYRPDLIVVCDETKTLGKKNCQGAPDFIIEIVSDHSKDRDLGRKKQNYEKAGVKEYWIIDLTRLYVNILVDNKYHETVNELSLDLKQPVSCIENCILDFQPIVYRYKAAP